MSTRTQDRAAAITPPIESNSQVVRAGVAVAERIRFPDSWRLEHITITADGNDTYFVLGGPSVTAVIADTTTVAAELITAFAGGECMHIPDGTEVRVDLSEVTPHDAPLFISHIESAAAGFVRITRSSGKTVTPLV